MHLERVTAATDEVYAALQHLLPQLNTSAPLPSFANLQALVAFPGSVLLVVRQPDKDAPIVGMATLSIVRAPTGVHVRLEDVVVDASLRGQGLGEALTKEAIRLAGELGANYLALTSNPRREAANRLYQRLGFKRWETNVYRYELSSLF